MRRKLGMKPVVAPVQKQTSIIADDGGYVFRLWTKSAHSVTGRTYMFAELTRAIAWAGGLIGYDDCVEAYIDEIPLLDNETPRLQSAGIASKRVLLRTIRMNYHAAADSVHIQYGRSSHGTHQYEVMLHASVLRENPHGLLQTFGIMP